MRSFFPHLVYLVFYRPLVSAWVSLKIWEVFFYDFYRKHFFLRIIYFM